MWIFVYGAMDSGTPLLPFPMISQIVSIFAILLVPLIIDASRSLWIKSDYFFFLLVTFFPENFRALCTGTYIHTSELLDSFLFKVLFDKLPF